MVKLRYLLIALGLLFLTICVGGTLYILNQIPTDRIELLSSKYSDRFFSFEEKSYLEEGSLVNQYELKNYLLFSEQNFDLKQVIEDEKLLPQKGYFLVKEDIELPHFIKNDCESHRCFQHRMSFEKMPSVFWKTLIAIEDQRFLDHRGVDYKSILRALWNDLKVLKIVQGGSTITQQLVKNIFLSNEKTISRKLKELIMAYYIEWAYSKDAILEAYFNEFIWGSLQGVRVKGLYSACLYYFNKRPKDIGRFEAAILIGLLKGPNYYHPLKHLDRLKKRTEVVFDKLVELGLMLESSETKWSEDKWKRWVKGLEENEQKRPFYSFWKIRENNLLSSYELSIFLNRADTLEKSISKENISIKAYLSEIDSEEKEFIYYSRGQRNVQKAMEQERHQIGSIIKPFLYRILRKKNPDFQKEFETKELEMSLKSGSWSPSEATKDMAERVSLEQALINSYNRPLIRASLEYGLDEIEDDLLGFFPNIKRPLKEYPAQLLGALELSVFEIHRAYKEFIKKECDHRPIESNVLKILSDPTKTTIRGRVDKYLKNHNFFGKTGTTNKGLNNWFVFFDGKNLGIFWVGWEGDQNIKDLRLYGSTTAFRLFQEFYQQRGKRFNEMECLLKDLQ